MSWADDEPDPWAADEPAAEGEAAAEGVAAAEGEAPAGGLPVTADGKLDWRAANLPKAPKPKYTLNWVRPLFLNYHYLHDYRTNYYDDVIEWMDRRNLGMAREEPRAQEWAERVMRTYDRKNEERSHKRASDMGILISYKPLPRHYSYHTRAYYSLKYQKIL